MLGWLLRDTLTALGGSGHRNKVTRVRYRTRNDDVATHTTALPTTLLSAFNQKRRSNDVQAGAIRSRLEVVGGALSENQHPVPVLPVTVPASDDKLEHIVQLIALS